MLLKLNLNKMRLAILLKLCITAAVLASCSTSDEANEAVTPVSPEPSPVTFDVPQNYIFVNADGESTISFEGQTTRLNQGAEILKDFFDFNATEASILSKLNEGQGFSNAALNDTKRIKNKIAEAVASSADQAEIRATFDGYIADQVEVLLSQYASKDEVPVASAGVVGKLESETTSTRFVNAKGLELDQAFNKGLIGAFTLDQIINDYLTLTEDEGVQEDNDAGIKAEGKPYTNAEHFWDEAYGYLYGASDEDVLGNPNSRHLDEVVDKFLYKYVQRVNADADFEGIADDIFQAFKTGRAAIVAKNYELSEAQADIIREKLSEIIGNRAVYYLRQGANKIRNSGVTAINDGSAFHDWSEGYGFIFSLQFTYNTATGAPYFTKDEVDTYIALLEANNGFWSLADDLTSVDALAEIIASRFDFTVAQAESNDAAQ